MLATDHVQTPDAVLREEDLVLLQLQDELEEPANRLFVVDDCDACHENSCGRVGFREIPAARVFASDGSMVLPTPSASACGFRD